MGHQIRSDSVVAIRNGRGVMTDAEKVRVLDDGPPPRPPLSGDSRRGSWVVLAVALALAGVLWVSGLRTAEPAESAPPIALSVAPSPDDRLPALTIPDVRGVRFRDIEDVLVESGFPDRSLRVLSTWVASHLQPEGVVVGQQPAPGRASTLTALHVTVSAGSPVVTFRELPTHLRELALTLAGFDPTEPILETETLAGMAYKTDDWVFGECAAVLLVGNLYPDQEYQTDCVIRETVAISGTLLDGTRYVVTGLPSGDYPFVSAAGAMVYDSDGNPRALGITSHGRLVDGVPPAVVKNGNRLRIEIGTWFTEVSVHPDLVGLVDAAVGADVAAAIRPATYGGLPVVDLSPPLRWPAPGDLPGRIHVDYGGFRVVAGCIRGVANVVCDPTGSISVEGAQSGFDVSGVSIVVQNG